MKTLVVYDSLFGNTEKVAQVISEAVGGDLKYQEKINYENFKKYDLIFFGSPTHGGRPSQAMQKFLEGIPINILKGKRAAVFDTRFAKNEHGTGLKLLMMIIDFAAPKIARVIKDKGAILISKPMGFIVGEKEGPLSKGELKRAKEWATELVGEK